MTPPVEVGRTFRFRQTVGESDVYLFAGITGDFSPNHVDEAAMAETPYGGRIAHGALIVGYMSTGSTMAVEAARDTEWGTPVSLGYDRIRFLHPAAIGDTLEIAYQITGWDADARRTQSECRVTNQAGTLVAIAEHIMKFVPNDA